MPVPIHRTTTSTHLWSFTVINTERTRVAVGLHRIVKALGTPKPVKSSRPASPSGFSPLPFTLPLPFPNASLGLNMSIITHLNPTKTYLAHRRGAKGRRPFPAVHF